MKKGMVMNSLWLKACGLALAGSLIGCTQTVIVFKPSKYVDPMPDLSQKAVPPGQEKADPMLKDQWNLKKVGIDEAAVGTAALQGNYNIKVAILSTGVDYNHEDLIGQIAINKAELTQQAPGDKIGLNRKDDDNNGLVDDVVGYDVVESDGFAYDRHGAGTAVAGIIAARQGNGLGIAGIMRDVVIYPVKYINDNGQSSVPNLISALDVALKSKSDVVYIQNVQLKLGGNQKNADVVGAELEMVRQALQKLKDAKVPVVVGSGDDMGDFGSSEMDKVLRSFDNVIVVTSSDASDSIGFMANFSFRNVLTSAPGEDVLTTKPLNQYGKVSGTAYAAAHVTAALALAKASIGSRVGYAELIPVLASAKGSDQVPGMARFSRGGNRLNITKFLTEAKSL